MLDKTTLISVSFWTSVRFFLENEAMRLLYFDLHSNESEEEAVKDLAMIACLRNTKPDDAFFGLFCLWLGHEFAIRGTGSSFHDTIT